MKLIAFARRRAGLTQEELGRRAGISQPALARIEKGHAVPRYDTVTRLLGECGIRLEPMPTPGRGVDRSTIRRMRELTPAERLQVAAREANALARMQPKRQRR